MVDPLDLSTGTELISVKKSQIIKRFHVTTSLPSSCPSATAAFAAALLLPPSCRRHRQAAMYVCHLSHEMDDVCVHYF
jgi:hypothetical protein